jgi:CheY-like chemotaxis protein
MSILIVDDSADQQLLLKTILNKAGHQDLLLADSATSAYDQLGLQQPPPHEGPHAVDLILMDFLMPGIDGVAATRHIKSLEAWRDIPVIVVTAKTALGDLQAAFAAGAMDFITKPVNSVELLARVNSALMLKKEMDCRKARERELSRSNEELQQALREVKVLKGLVPICASCKKIRNDQGFWQQLEEYLQQHSEAEFSHGLCTPCIKKLYPGVYAD